MRLARGLAAGCAVVALAMARPAHAWWGGWHSGWGFDQSLRGDRILADEIRSTRQYAAEILRPWAVGRAVDERMADTAVTQLLSPGEPKQEMRRSCVR